MPQGGLRHARPFVVPMFTVDPPIDRKRPAAVMPIFSSGRIEGRGQAIAGAEFGFGADEIVALKQGKVVSNSGGT